MKRIRCTFYRPEQVKVAEFENIIGKLEADFHAICSGEADKGDLCRYAKKLISVAKPLEKNPEMLFLGLDEPGNMPSDARVEYFYKPTYLGTAVVIKTVMQVPLFWKEEENTIRGMLLACTGRGFRGHGFDDLKGMIETLGIFSEANASDFVRNYPDVCPEFTQLYTESINHLKEIYDKGAVCNSWGEDYSEQAKQVLELALRA